MSKVIKRLSEIPALTQVDLDKIAAQLKDESDAVAKEAGLKLVQQADSFGLRLKDYLVLAGGKGNINESGSDGMTAYDKLLAALNLPIRSDTQNGIHLQAASDTFYTYPGTRILFKSVLDDMLRFAVRQDQMEVIDPIIIGTRQISGNELIKIVVNDDSNARTPRAIAEYGEIPIDQITTSENSVKLFKVGRGIRISYEFERRANIDVLTPYLARIARQLEISKVAAATNMMINGDGVQIAAPVVSQSSFNTGASVAATAGKIAWENFFLWLVSRAKAAVPVDTILMNWDTWGQWSLMFGRQNQYNGYAIADALSRSGVTLQRDPTPINLIDSIKPVLSSAMPTGHIMGFIKNETIEQLIEAGSQIAEMDRVFSNQSITYLNSEVVGFHLPWGDTRQVYDYTS